MEGGQQRGKRILRRPKEHLAGYTVDGYPDLQNNRQVDDSLASIV